MYDDEQKCFESKPSLEDTLIPKNVEKSYKLAASLQGGRDLIEEYVTT
jgi:hypothetical protein